MNELFLPALKGIKWPDLTIEFQKKIAKESPIPECARVGDEVGMLPEGDVYGVRFVIVRGGPWIRRVLYWLPDLLWVRSVRTIRFGREAD